MLSKGVVKWGLFVLLSFIWGSSFILMKEGLKGLNAYQVAGVRILSAGLVLMPFAAKAFRSVRRSSILYIILSGILGSFIPAILFCIAETQIDSALAGILNALTPLFVITVGAVFFHTRITIRQLTGVLVGFAGMLLVLARSLQISYAQVGYALLILIATFCYGLNANMVNRKLRETGSTEIATIAFTCLILPALVQLGLSGFFQHNFGDNIFLKALGAAALLGLLGTALATVLFYVLMKQAGVLFASMVTYGIPFVALFWGLLAHESISLLQVAGLMIILAGVYITHK